MPGLYLSSNSVQAHLHRLFIERAQAQNFSGRNSPAARCHESRSLWKMSTMARLSSMDFDIIKIVMFSAINAQIGIIISKYNYEKSATICSDSMDSTIIK